MLRYQRKIDLGSTENIFATWLQWAMSLWWMWTISLGSFTISFPSDSQREYYLCFYFFPPTKGNNLCRDLSTIKYWEWPNIQDDTSLFNRTIFIPTESGLHMRLEYDCCLVILHQQHAHEKKKSQSGSLWRAVGWSLTKMAPPVQREPFFLWKNGTIFQTSFFSPPVQVAQWALMHYFLSVCGRNAN